MASHAFTVLGVEANDGRFCFRVSRLFTRCSGVGEGSIAAIEQFRRVKAVVTRSRARRITIFFFGISLFSLDNHFQQGYISALVEKY
jgi:hypothetical protein